MKKKAVLVASFGTSYPKVLSDCIESTEKSIREAFSGYELRRAFTSGFIIGKLAKRDGVNIDDAAGALEKLKDEGFSRIVVQPLHIIPGYEYHKVKKTVYEFERKKAFDEIVLGEPLLFNNEDYKTTIEAIKFQFKDISEDEAVVFMGHGTAHFSNACYYCLQSYMDEEGINAYIANVEGCPSLCDAISKLKEKNIKKIVLMPLMLVAGDHAINDMAGGEDSWKSILENEGFEVSVYMHGLGENEAVRRIFAAKALKAAKPGICQG